MKLQHYIKLARKEKGYSLVYLANLSGLTYSMLYRIEDGSIVKPHPDILKKIAAPLDIRYEHLLETTGYISEDAKLTNIPTSLVQQLPLLRWNTAYQFLSLSDALPDDISKKSIHTALSESPLFAITLSDHTYAPLFNRNEILIIHKTKAFSHLDYVVYLDHDNTSLALKQHHVINKKHYLTSFTAQDPLYDINLTNSINVFRVIEKRF